MKKYYLITYDTGKDYREFRSVAINMNPADWLAEYPCVGQGGNWKKSIVFSMEISERQFDKLNKIYQ